MQDLQALFARPLDARSSLEDLKASYPSLSGAALAGFSWFLSLPEASAEMLQDLPDLEGALVAMDALCRADHSFSKNPPANVLTRLLRLGAQSRDRGRFAARREDVIAVLVDALEEARCERDLRAAAQEILGPGSTEESLQTLRRWRSRELTRAFYREAMGLGSLEDVLGEISGLAAACLDAVLGFVRAEMALKGDALDAAGNPIPLVILALGKLGGWELNFSSDVDVVFLYGTDEGQVDNGKKEAWSVHNFFHKLARRVTQIMEASSPDGRLWRMDLRLRPGGAQGPLVHSVRAAEDYYQAWGTTFERVVWLRGRAVAGDLALGRRFVETLRPFVYRKALDMKALDEIRELKGKIDRHAVRTLSLSRRRSRTAASRKPPAGWSPEAIGLLGWDLKVGEGGIREIEFVVQALQLVYGGRRPELQGPSTLPSIQRLVVAGLLPSREAEHLASIYIWWRLLEHRIQMEGEVQTHALPTRPELFLLLASRMGEDLHGFVERVLRCRGIVQSIFARLLQSQQDESEWSPAVRAILDLRDLVPEEQEVQELFREAGFARPGQAAGNFLVLRQKPRTPFGAGASPARRALGERMLSEATKSADPDLALVHLTSFLLNLKRGDVWLSALEARPAAVTALVGLFGSTRYFSQLLIRQPGLVQTLFGGGGWSSLASGDTGGALETLDKELQEEVATVPVREARLGALRRFKARRELRVSLADVAGLLSVEQVGERLSMLAEACLRQVFEEAMGELLPRYGVPRQADGSRASFCVLALGKLGGRELSYGSDLDLLFLHQGEGYTDGARSTSNQDFFGRLARRMISFITTQLAQGRLYEIDARLRPSGRQGALVVSLGSFRQYHRGSAQLWEKQALLRARPVAGDETFFGEVAEAVREAVFVHRSESPAEVCRELAQMRRRMNASVVARTRGAYNLKLSPGGIVDIEFAVQALQLAFGAERPELCAASTARALRLLMHAGIVARDQHAGALDAYCFLRRLEGRLRMFDGSGRSELPLTDALLVARMARAVGYRSRGAGERLLRELESATTKGLALFGSVVERSEFLGHNEQSPA